MFPRLFQIRLWHLLAVLAVAAIFFSFLRVFVLPMVGVGARRHLPRAEEMILVALARDGLSICDEFR